MPWSSRLTTTWTWPCGWYWPPVTPNTASQRPSGPSSAAGMIVWNGLLPGANSLGWPGSSTNPAPRFWSTKPKPGTSTREPKPW